MRANYDYAALILSKRRGREEGSYGSLWLKHFIKKRVPRKRFPSANKLPVVKAPGRFTTVLTVITSLVSDFGVPSEPRIWILRNRILSSFFLILSSLWRALIRIREFFAHDAITRGIAKFYCFLRNYDTFSKWRILHTYIHLVSTPYKEKYAISWLKTLLKSKVTLIRKLC